MRELPIINANLRVEAIGFRPFQDMEAGVLITPWFMNLILLPGITCTAELEQGRKINVGFPSGDIEFTAAQDEDLGLYLSAVLFSTVDDFENQETARAIATQIMRDLFLSKNNPQHLSRRSLFTATGHDDA